GAAQPAAAAAQLVDERADDARPRGSDRVPQGDRATVHVDPLLVDLEHPHRVDGDGGEGLVDLPEIDVGGLLADLLERLYRGPRRRLGEVREVVRDLAVGEQGGD